MALTTSIDLKVAATLTKAITGLASDLSQTINWSLKDSLADGTAVDQSNRVYFTQQSVTSGVPVDIDLSGALTDIYGDAVVFAEVTCIAIKNLSTTAAEILHVGGDAAALASIFDAADNELRIGPGGAVVLYNPAADAYGVTATTADILQIDAASGAPTFSLIVIGKSA